ncbi:hypothetical protein [Frankia sp. QA3]|uniref:hypothetical protein n=1 Tax=Frankia sp. QA3 TaxID=710111 RepID=UPI000269CA7C|nr:hypothetical protein [Frankia sp. QA3]EIV94913.1 Tfp pilus assembly protein PilF [Frankia sp. QA3]
MQPRGHAGRGSIAGSSGDGGVEFRRAVAAYAVVAGLAENPLRGLGLSDTDAFVAAVVLETEDAVDDLRVDFRGGCTAFIQAKRTLEGGNVLTKAVAQWVRAAKESLDPTRHRLVIAAGHLSESMRALSRALDGRRLSVPATPTPQEAEQLRRVEELLAPLDAAARDAVLRCAVVWHLDVEETASASTQYALQQLRGLVEGGSAHDAMEAWSALLDTAGHAARRRGGHDLDGWRAAMRDRRIDLMHGSRPPRAGGQIDRIAPPSRVFGDVELRERLELLPPTCAPRLLAAWRDDRDLTWKLVTALTSVDARPAAVLTEWEGHQPAWLRGASWQVQLAAAELAVGYGQVPLGADLFVAAARQGAPRRTFWLARAAILYDEPTEAEKRSETLAALGSLHEATDPYARAVIALLVGDERTAAREVDRWSPDPDDRSLRTDLRLRLAGIRGVTRESIDRALQILAEALRERWLAGIAINRAGLLIRRCRRGESPNLPTDVREATELAVRARDERRRYRGASVEAVELACQAAIITDDPDTILALGTVSENGATADEADSPLVREYVAVASIRLGDLAAAREQSQRVIDPSARARLEAMLAEAENRDSDPYWRRAIELAPNDDHLRAALSGLADTGAVELPRFEEFAARHPEEASEIRALSEVASGDAAAAIKRLRPRRGQSVAAAIMLARAYQMADRIDDQVQTLRDAASDFNDPSLRQGAAEVFAHAGRVDEAQSELDALLTSTGPDWSGRPSALRMAARLSYEARQFDRTVVFFEAALQIEPDNASMRWALVHILVYNRGDLVRAWRVFSSAPAPLEPSSVAEAELWIHLHIRNASPDQGVAGCLRLLRRFSDSEQFAAFAVGAMLTGWRPLDETPPDLVAEVQFEIERFFQRWPASQYLQRITADDIERLIEQMTAMVRPTHSEQQALHQLGRRLLFGQVPLSLLAGATGRSHAEIVVRRGAGLLPARHVDPAEIAACASAVRSVADQEIVIDLPAVAVLRVLAVPVRELAMAVFSRVMTTDETQMDARAARDSLARRGTSSWVYDERLDRGRLAEITPAEATRLADESAALLEEISRLPRHPRGGASFEDFQSPPLNAWTSVIDLEWSPRTWCTDCDRLTTRRSGGP